MKSQAKVVVIGGGIVGCSALYHLAKMGCTDTLLVELDELTSGSTWHAAGNVPTFAGNRNMMRLQKYSTELYSRLAEEVDYPINYHMTGSVRLAQSRERMQELHHVADMAKAMGYDYEMLSVSELKNLYPWVETHDLHGALWDGHDGDIDPSQVTQALAKGARQMGAEIQRFNWVRAIEKTASGEWLVKTDKGDVCCEVVINAGGYRGAQVAAMVGQYLPMVSLEHQYLVTEGIPELAAMDKSIPLLRDPDDSYYLRQERDALILGPYEKERAVAHWENLDVPDDFPNQLWEDDLERLEWYIEAAMKRVPMLEKGGVQRVINGPIPYSPDGLPYIGPAYGLDNFYHACGFSFGICQGGGAGKTIAEWVLEGRPEWDLWCCDPRRYTDYANKKYVKDKAIELYQHEYAIGFPHEERPAGRPAKATPVYSELAQKGAMFGARGGWERATWFPRESDEARDDLSFERPHFEAAIAAECQAVRERVAILDLGGFSKYELSGEGANDWLDHMIAGPLPKQDRVSLSYCLNENGGVWSEFTITRLGDNHFYLISAAAALWHDEDWLRSHLPSDGSVVLENVTGKYGSLVLVGPKSRDVLRKVTTADLSNKGFPWLSHREIEVGFTSMRALRVNYVGELGWELHVPVEHQLSIYKALWAAGEEFGIADFGMYAMDSLRLEKCYRTWKGDLDHEYSPLRSALDRFVDLNKPDFIGKAALVAEKENGIPDVFVPLLVDTDRDAGYGASVFHNGERVGMVTSGGYGHTIQKSIALAYVKTELAAEGTELEVEIYGEKAKAVVAVEPLFDPKNERLRVNG